MRREFVLGPLDGTLFTEGELRALLQREEGQFLELKSLWDRSGSVPRSL